MISLGALVAAGVAPTQARLFIEPLTAACARFDINTPTRAASFIGQCMVESDNFTRTDENLFYTRPERILEIFPSRVTSLQGASKLARNPKGLASVVYAEKNGNGDEASGDGWKFHGRGLIQLTGRSNYADAAVGLNRPYVDSPELVALPADACLTAAWYFHCHKLNLLADSWQIDAITRAVNGRAMLHADRRRQFSEQALAALK